MSAKIENPDSIVVKPTSKISWFGHTKVHGLELFMALFGLVTTAIVVDYGLFALFNYIKGVGVDATSFSEMTLWVIASMVIWIPLTTVFYLRSRGEHLHSPARKEQISYKALTITFMVINILAAVGAFFAAFYVAFRMLVMVGYNESDAADQWVRFILPALIMVVLHIGMIFAFPRGVRPSRKLFAIVFASVSTVVMIALMFLSIGSIRSLAADNQVQNDLSVIHVAVRDHYNDERSLPNDLDQLDIGDDAVKSRLDRYTYIRDSSTKFQLCADFNRDTLDGRPAGITPMALDTSTSDTGMSVDDYKSMYYYGYDFGMHKKGRHCFEMSVYSAYPESSKSDAVY
ncbi:MAG: hypothetical protein WBB94_04155 [Candidatus Saccharimonadaceae bacterium]